MSNTKMITGYLIDVDNERAEVITIPNDLREFYRVLNCHMVDFATRQVGVKFKNRKVREYDIICDEEGSFKDDPKISAYDNLGRAMLVGNLLIVNYDYDNADAASLTKDDIKYLQRFIVMQGTHKHPKPYPMLSQCEYVMSD